MKLSTEELKTYHDDGYLFYKNRILSDEEIKSTLSEIDRIIAGDIAFPDFLKQLEDHSSVEKSKPTEANPIRKLQGLSYFLPTFEKLAKDPRILDPIESILGPNVKLYTDEYFCKNPSRAGSTYKAYPWHQDAPGNFFPTHTYATCWIALDPATPENGCMQFIPRSHIYGQIRDKFVTKFLQHPVLEKPIYAERPAGYAVLHHGLNFHSSQPNRSSKSRRALAFHFISADTHYTGVPEGQDVRITQPTDTSDRFRFMLVRGREFANCA
jgi:ectoine hydroxylase-related dioxygenase (phytanoyl-CoA dioxygenase family)